MDPAQSNHQHTRSHKRSAVLDDSKKKPPQHPNVNMSGKLVIFFLVAVALACIGSATAQYIVYSTPAISSYYHPYGYTYPLSYNYRFGGYPYLLRR